MATTQYITYVRNGNGGSSVVPTYANFAALPTGVPDGSLAVTLDTHTLYVYNSGTMIWSPISGAAIAIQTFVLNNTNITNKYVTLSSPPATPANTILDVRDGPGMYYGADFSVSGSQLMWNGLALDGILSSGDEITVLYSL